MSRLLQIVVFLYVLFDPTFCMIECNTDDRCSCYDNDDDGIQIQCPIEDEKLFVYIYEDLIVIDCPNDLNQFRTDYLPNITIIEIDYFRMKFCAWFPEPFHKILKKFSLTKIGSLEFFNSPSQNIRVKAESFENLQQLQALKLNENGIADLDEGVFRNTPNLQILELNNNNITLKKNMFKNVPLLNHLDLSSNGLDILPTGIFEPLRKLEVLNLWNNKLKKLDGSSFNGLVNLKTLELSLNHIEYISEDVFQELKNLRNISLLGNKLKKVPPDLFIYNKKLKLVRMVRNLHLQLPDYLFANSSLVQVDLKNCMLQTIPENIFENSTNLRIIKLDMNYLTDLPQNLFKGLYKLEQIRLQNNFLTSVSKVFRGLNQLKVLSLQDNLISALTSKDFSDLTNLEKINLKGNKITQVDFNLFSKLTNLRKIDLSFNNITTPPDEIFPLDVTKNLTDINLSDNNISIVKLGNLHPTKDISIKLDYNKVNFVDFTDVALNSAFPVTRISLRHNPIICDCHNYDLVKYFQTGGSSIDIFRKKLTCFGPNQLKNVSLFSLSLKNLTCPLEVLSENYIGCPEKCLCEWRPVDRAIIVDCSYRNLTEFPKINLSSVDFVDFNQTEVNFEGNHLRRVEIESMGYDNVTKLFLSHNNIEEVIWLPPKLEVLEMDHNNITNLDVETVTFLRSLPVVKLSLHENPWLCDCNSEPLSSFLRENPPEKPIVCVERKKNLVDLNEADLCDNTTLIYLISLFLSILLSILIGIVLYYRYQEQIKILLFSKNLCLWWVASEEEFHEDKLYDAFISCSQKDEAFVIKHLLPKLESGPQNYKLCLQCRDWIPGEIITTQIINSILQSRRILIILSNNFLKNVWSKTEFRTAHSEAMKDKGTKIIIVLYGDIDIDTLEEELKMYLKINTYVRWNDPYFWNKLKYALPHKKINRRYKVRNMLRPQELNLISSEPSSPGSTPPINLNPSLAKINPLSFIHKDKNVSFV